MIRHRNGKQHPTNFPPKGDLKDLLISSSILLLAFEFSAVCKISVIFEIPIVIFKINYFEKVNLARALEREKFILFYSFLFYSILFFIRKLHTFFAFSFI